MEAKANFARPPSQSKPHTSASEAPSSRRTHDIGTSASVTPPEIRLPQRARSIKHRYYSHSPPLPSRGRSGRLAMGPQSRIDDGPQVFECDRNTGLSDTIPSRGRRPSHQRHKTHASSSNQGFLSHVEERDDRSPRQREVEDCVEHSEAATDDSIEVTSESIRSEAPTCASHGEPGTDADQPQLRTNASHAFENSREHASFHPGNYPIGQPIPAQNVAHRQVSEPPPKNPTRPASRAIYPRALQESRKAAMILGLPQEPFPAREASSPPRLIPDDLKPTRRQVSEAPPRKLSAPRATLALPLEHSRTPTFRAHYPSSLQASRKAARVLGLPQDPIPAQETSSPPHPVSDDLKLTHRQVSEPPPRKLLSAPRATLALPLEHPRMPASRAIYPSSVQESSKAARVLGLPQEPIPARETSSAPHPFPDDLKLTRRQVSEPPPRKLSAPRATLALPLEHPMTPASRVVRPRSLQESRKTANITPPLPESNPSTSFPPFAGLVHTQFSDPPPVQVRTRERKLSAPHASRQLPLERPNFKMSISDVTVPPRSFQESQMTTSVTVPKRGPSPQSSSIAKHRGNKGGTPPLPTSAVKQRSAASHRPLRRARSGFNLLRPTRGGGDGAHPPQSGEKRGGFLTMKRNVNRRRSSRKSIPVRKGRTGSLPSGFREIPRDPVQRPRTPEVRSMRNADPYEVQYDYNRRRSKTTDSIPSGLNFFPLLTPPPARDSRAFGRRRGTYMLEKLGKPRVDGISFMHFYRDLDRDVSADEVKRESAKTTETSHLERDV